MGEDSYLAAANSEIVSGTNVNSNIYKWNGTSFVYFTGITTAGSTDWEPFTIDGNHYLALANKPNEDSTIYLGDVN